MNTLFHSRDSVAMDTPRMIEVMSERVRGKEVRYRFDCSWCNSKQAKNNMISCCNRRPPAAYLL